METHKGIKHVAALAAFLACAGFLLLMFILSPLQVSAKVLHGHLEKTKMGPDGDGEAAQPSTLSAPSQPATRPSNSFESSQPFQPQTPQPAKLPEAAILNNTFPRSFEGSWKCETLVTDSGVDTVPAGSKLLSDVQFARLADGRIVARWNQPGWTETQANAMTFNAKEARVDRTSYYFGDGVNGAWAARSRDHFVQINADTIAVKSYVDQYIDGQYVGRYRTASMLHRVFKKPEVANYR